MINLAIVIHPHTSNHVEAVEIVAKQGISPKCCKYKSIQAESDLFNDLLNIVSQQ